MNFWVLICSRFLKGLFEVGEGKWKIISRNYVVTKTPSQVASHAQKYHKRKMQEVEVEKREIKRKPRVSIHDRTIDDALLGNKQNIHLQPQEISTVLPNNVPIQDERVDNHNHNDAPLDIFTENLQLLEQLHLLYGGLTQDDWDFINQPN